MGDHFVLLVDQLLTESTLEAAVESRRNLLKQLVPPENNDTIIDCASHLDSDTIIDCASHLDSETDMSPRKVVECRICQDEDLESLLETLLMSWQFKGKTFLNMNQGNVIVWF